MPRMVGMCFFAKSTISPILCRFTPGMTTGHQQNGQPRRLAVFYGPQLYVQHVPRAYLAVDGVVQAVELEVYEVAARGLERLGIARHISQLYAVGVHLQVYDAQLLAQPEDIAQVLTPPSAPRPRAGRCNRGFEPRAAAHIFRICARSGSNFSAFASAKQTAQFMLQR